MRRAKSTRRALSFTAHQVCEYLVGGGTVVQSGRFTGRASMTMALLGVAIVALAAMSDGKAGAVRWLPPIAHRLVDVGVISIAVASPWLFGFGGELEPVLIVESMAAVLLVLSGATRYRGVTRSRPASSPRRGPRTRVDDASRVAGYFAGKAARRGPRAVGRAAGRATRKRQKPE
jgi:hypothetical protein